jgi:hypothetical protein
VSCGEEMSRKTVALFHLDVNIEKKLEMATNGHLGVSKLKSVESQLKCNYWVMITRICARPAKGRIGIAYRD